MRIAIIADTHLGYSRFEEDAYKQAREAFLDAAEKADLILFAGDIFDTKVPKLETLNQAISIFQAVRDKAKAVIAIHGNHERRAKEMVNPAKLLANAGFLTHIHGTATTVEKGGEKVQVFGLGNVPEDYAEVALEKSLRDFAPDQGAFRILMIHQTIKELIPFGKNGLTLEYLESLPFDIVVNGHIHKREALAHGRFLIPGSTVITQLKKDETEPKGYYIYDTKEKRHEFIPIESRRFFYEEIEVNDANQSGVLEAIKQKIDGIREQDRNALIAIKIKGTLKQGLSASDIRIPRYENAFIDNRLDEQALNARLEEIRSLRAEKLSVRDLAIKELEEKTKDISAFDSAELFEKLITGADETLDYLEGLRKNGKTAAGA